MQKKLKLKKSAVLLTSLVLVMTAVAGGTLAFLLDTADPVVNTFEPSEVPIEVHEDIKNGYKENVQIKNTGNVDAYIRAKVLVNWIDSEGNIVPSVPQEYTRTENTEMFAKNTGWVYYDEDGFYYYIRKVGSNESTDILIGECKMFYDGTDEPQYRLQVDIIAQSIQAEPSSVVETEWGIDPTTLN